MDNIIEFINQAFPTDALDLKSKYRQTFDYVLKETQNKVMYRTIEASMMGNLIFTDSFMKVMVFRLGEMSLLSNIFSNLEESTIKNQILNKHSLFKDDYKGAVFLHNYIYSHSYDFDIICNNKKYIDNMDVAVVFYTIFDYIEGNFQTIMKYLYENYIINTIRRYKHLTYTDLQKPNGWQSFDSVSTNSLLSHACLLVEKLKY